MDLRQPRPLLRGFRVRGDRESLAVPGHSPNDQNHRGNGQSYNRHGRAIQSLDRRLPRHDGIHPQRLESVKHPRAHLDSV